METRSLRFIADATNGELRNASPESRVTGISTDSRAISRGELFIALVGDRFAAHEFLSDEIGRRAGACLGESHRIGSRIDGFAQIRVADSRAALGRLGARYRKAFDLPVIGVTGSNGKTSTKHFLRAVLGQSFRVCSSPASFNNEVGVPLSLLNLETRSEVAVLELGTNHPGEIKPLAEMIQPTIGGLTSIGRSHLEFFGSVDAIAHEKGFLGECLPENGLFVVNGDASHLESIVSRVSARVVTVGFSDRNEWRIQEGTMGPSGSRFTVCHDSLGGSCDFTAKVVGRHQMLNLGLAIAVGVEMGLTVEALQEGVRRCEPERMRAEWEVVGGVTLFNDTYNANADSMIAALETLRAYPCQGRRHAVIGEMGELGEVSESSHREVGKVAARCGIDSITALGHYGEYVEDGARQEGHEWVASFADMEQIFDRVLDRLAGLVRAGDSVLIKASRRSGLERLASALRSRLNENKGNDL